MKLTGIQGGLMGRQFLLPRLSGEHGEGLDRGLSGRRHVARGFPMAMDIPHAAAQ